MDINAETEEIVIVSLIFGVRSVSALSERAVLNLADHVKETNPRLSRLLSLSRMVDDLGDSDMDLLTVESIIEDANKLFESVGLCCKGWSVSGSPPHPDVTHDGISVNVGGMIWFPEVDTVSVKIPPLHFGKKARGKLVVGTEIFEGSFADMEKFVPNPMTRRQVVSKFCSLFDMFGKLTPVSAPMKLCVRRGTKETDDWNGYVSAETRSVVVKNLWRLYKLQGIQFNRARIPPDAVDTKLHLVCCVDAADQLKIVGVWARFRKKAGGFSSQLVIGRSLLGREEGTIPKEELEALTIGSNLLWICRKAMEGWLEDYSLCGDSVIALCWITSEKKRLSLFHRNRVMQTRFNTDLDKLFHVRSEFNPADIGTRSEKVRDEDIGPDSVWENGLDWMRGDFEDAIEADVLKHAKNLRMNEEEEHEYDRGLVFERCPEILIRGHHAYLSSRVENIASRAKFSNYIFMPTKFNFRKVVRVTALMFKYIRNTKIGVWPKSDNKFKMFMVQKTGNNLVRKEEKSFDFFVNDDKFADICLWI